LSEPPLKVDFEKIYRIDRVGNVDVERSWTLLNRAGNDIDISQLRFYVTEVAGVVTNVRAEDSSGPITSFTQSRIGSKTKISIDPRPTTLSSQQSYKMTLFYRLTSLVHKLGDIWPFTDSIEGMNTSQFSSLLSDKSDVRLQVVLPILEKRFWQTLFYESEPKGSELSTEEKTRKDEEHKVLEWRTSLFSDDWYTVELVYGIKTNTRLAQFLTVVGTAIVVGVINLLFKLISG